ncbi:MAG: SpoIIE family protein phosphatase [Syntrophomonadaceae bacterium]|nr:SpoIIE family protein phosphatase [Syntrophomonadaceae bacterium]
MVELETGIWQRTAPKETVCGDSYLVGEENRVFTIAVVDGLGHGPAARQAADTAVGALQNNQNSLQRIIPEIHRQLMGTRGAVLSIARFDLDSGIIKFAGVGNIYTYVIFQGRVKTLMSVDGFLGGRFPSIREYDLDLEELEQLIMVSDGIAAIPGRDLLKISWQKAEDMARTIGEKWSLHRDDATVVVVKKKGS